MSFTSIFWNALWGKKVLDQAMNGLERWARVEALTQAKMDCPVDTGTMRNSLDVERSDAERCVYLGGGGAAKKYILRQELDRSLHHRVGKAGFIRDSVMMHLRSLPEYLRGGR